MQASGIIYYHDWDYVPHPEWTAKIPAIPASGRVAQHASSPAYADRTSFATLLGTGLLALSLGGLIGPVSPMLRMEGAYRLMQVRTGIERAQTLAIRDVTRLFTPRKIGSAETPVAKPVLFNPLTAPDGSVITPVSTDFGLVIPKIGVNAAVIPAVDPANPGVYRKALKEGVAHASTSYFPDEDGTVYLFSDSTSYDWFVKDLNAVFYLVKNLDAGDTIVIMYKNKEYTYRITDKKIVSPQAVSYLAPRAGAKRLILQTCWPPGSTTERLLIFADLVQSTDQSI